MTDISSSQGFQLLNISTADALKAGTLTTTTPTYKAYIPLSLIKGVYDYHALKTTERGLNLIRFFTRSADNSNMIVNMPLAKMKNPRYLRTYQQGDSALTNNFSISVSDYHNNYNSYHDYNYLNVAEFTIDKVKAGSMNIKSSVSPTLGKNYTSLFNFSNGYTAKYMYSSGDTTVSSFTILKGTNVLYQEKLVTIKVKENTNAQGNEDKMEFGHEHQYTLTIGNVTVVREPGTAPKVYVNGQLQTKATVSVVDEDENMETEHSVCEKRDLKITFDDGTTATVSSLIGKSISDISSIYKSLHQVYFAAYVVDWLGYDIYYKRS